MVRKKTHSLITKILSILILLGILVALSSALVGYFRFTEVITERYSQETSQIGNMIVDFVKASDVDTAFQKLESVTTPEQLKELRKETVYASRYAELVRFLDDIRRNTGIINAFVAGFEDGQGNILEEGVYFAGVSGERTDPEIALFGEEVLLTDAQKIISEIYASGRTPEIQQTIETAEGPIMNAYLPVLRKGEVVAVVGLQEKMNDLVQIRIEYLWSVAFYSLLVTLAVVILFVWLSRRILERPLKKITRAVADFPKNRHEITGKLESIKTGDELQTLAEAFIQMEGQLQEYIINLARATSEKERVQTELNLAHDIQKNMLPTIFPPFPERNEFSIFALMEPAKEVGGDFYDFFLIDEDHLGFIIADVSGKGVPAALFMVIAKTLIQDHAKLGLSPAQVFTNVNEILCQNNGAELFVTAWFGILDLKSGKLTYVNAGHNPPLIRRSDGTYEFLKKRGGLVLAGLEGIRYRQFEMDLDKGDRIFLYTDGVTEAQNTEDELYGEERLLKALNSNKTASVEEMLPAIREDIRTFSGEAEQFDDITMLEIEIKELFSNDEE